MATFPRYGRELPEDAKPSTPQIHETMVREDEDRLEGFMFRELGMFKLRTPRATPGQNFLAGAEGSDLEHTRILGRSDIEDG